MNELQIEKIKVNGRFRTELGDLQSLEESILSIGLLHPIVVDTENNLIAGQRRLEVFKKLNRTVIPVTIISLENPLKGQIDENQQRKDFTPSEISAISKAMKRVLKPKAQKKKSESAKKYHRGKKKEGSDNLAKPFDVREEIAEAVGVSPATLAKIDFVAEAAEKDPEKYAAIAEKMNETGNVDAAYKKAKKEKAKENPESLREQARKDIEVRWQKTLNELMKMIQGIEDAGGIQKLIKAWDKRYREGVILNLRSLNSKLTLWIKELKV